jgi:hypothetical protein
MLQQCPEVVATRVLPVLLLILQAIGVAALLGSARLEIFHPFPAILIRLWSPVAGDLEVSYAQPVWTVMLPWMVASAVAALRRL